MVKKGAIYLYIVYIAINVIYVFIDSNNIDWLTKTESIIYILANAAQYGFIIIYLLNKSGESSEESIVDSLLDNQSNLGTSKPETHQMLPQDLQPKQEEVKPIIPDALQTPVEEQKVAMPVIQQAVINEQMPEAPAASPLPQIKPPEIEQSNILKQPETPTVEPLGGQPLEQQTEQPKGASIIQ